MIVNLVYPAVTFVVDLLLIITERSLCAVIATLFLVQHVVIHLHGNSLLHFDWMTHKNYICLICICDGLCVCICHGLFVYL